MILVSIIFYHLTKNNNDISYYYTDTSYEIRKEKPMELHALGLNYSHDGSFDIRRPNGSGDNLLLIFKSSAVVRLHGREYSVSPDSAILYKKALSRYTVPARVFTLTTGFISIATICSPVTIHSHMIRFLCYQTQRKLRISYPP